MTSLHASAGIAGPSTSTHTHTHTHSSLPSHLSTELAFLSSLILKARDQHRHQPFLQRMREIVRLGKILLGHLRSRTSAAGNGNTSHENNGERMSKLLVKLTQALFRAHRTTSQIIELHHFLPLQITTLSLYSRIFTIALNAAHSIGLDASQLILIAGEEGQGSYGYDETKAERGDQKQNQKARAVAASPHEGSKYKSNWSEDPVVRVPDADIPNQGGRDGDAEGDQSGLDIDMGEIVARPRPTSSTPIPSQRDGNGSKLASAYASEVFPESPESSSRSTSRPRNPALLVAPPARPHLSDDVGSDGSPSANNDNDDDDGNPEMGAAVSASRATSTAARRHTASFIPTPLVPSISSAPLLDIDRKTSSTPEPLASAKAKAKAKAKAPAPTRPAEEDESQLPSKAKRPKLSLSHDADLDTAAESKIKQKSSSSIVPDGKLEKKTEKKGKKGKKRDAMDDIFGF